MFTHEEFDLLSQALDALQAKSGTESILGLMMGTMMARSQEEADRRFVENQRKMKEAEAKQAQLKEDIVLLRAKLIQLRRSHDANLDTELRTILEG